MIRKARKNDFKSIYLLINQLKQTTFIESKFQETFSDIIDDNDKMFYVFEDNNQIKGFISCYIKKTLHHNGISGEIIELVVLKEFQGQGIGSKLLVFIEELAHKKGFLEIELSSGKLRTDAHCFYQQHGFINDHFNLIKKLC
ncbi:MAG: GNAT family N-acetyltransferase [Erysipelotrichaceae bacterium]